MPTTNSQFLSSHSLLQAVRLPFWLACFLAAIGITWRTPLASVALLSTFLLLLVTIEWIARRLTATKFILHKTSTIESADETFQQQMMRSKTAEGLDRLDGTFCVEFPTDTMSATVHIPFCPAFDKVPKIQVFPMDTTHSNLRMMPPKMFGVRVDVKRSSLETKRLRFAIIAEE